MNLEAEFIDVLFNNYNKIKDDFEFAILKDLANLVIKKLHITEEQFDKFLYSSKDNGLISFSIMPGREILMIRIKKI